MVMAPNRTGRNLRCNIWSEIKIELKASLHGRTGLRSIPEPSLRTAIDQQRCCIAVSALRKGWNTTDVACAKRSLSRVSTAFVLQYFPARSFESLQVSKTYLLSVSWFSLDSCRYCVAIERGNSMRCNNRCSQCHSAILPFCHSAGLLCLFHIYLYLSDRSWKSGDRVRQWIWECPLLKVWN
jgi:hypothetical protein